MVYCGNKKGAEVITSAPFNFLKLKITEHQHLKF